MQVLGRDIGDALDRMYEEIANRVRTELDQPIRMEPSEGALSSVDFDDDAVLIQLHPEVPTHALPHVLAVALQHVRQHLDHYPEVRRPQGDDSDEGPLIRTALRELVLAPEAESHLATLQVDQDWETELRHQGMKALLSEPMAEWNQRGTPENLFVVLQAARLSIQHPPKLWKGLERQLRKASPLAADMAEDAANAVRLHRWGSPRACFQSLVEARDRLSMSSVALIENRETGEIR